MRTRASARLEKIAPCASPLTTCCRKSAIASIPEVRAADALVALELVGRPCNRHPSYLEHVGARGDAERDRRVLLDNQHRQPLLFVQLLDDREELPDDRRRKAERRLVEHQ